MILFCSVVLHYYRGELGAPDSANNTGIYADSCFSSAIQGPPVPESSAVLL